MTLVFGKVSDLTPEQVVIAIRLAAERAYKYRLYSLAYRDWEEACRRVRTKENPYPSNEQIRPVAEEVYHERLKQEALVERRAGIILLKQDGNTYPTEEQIQRKAEQLHQDRQKQMADTDWLEAEKGIMQSRRVCYPIEWKTSIA